MRSRQARKIVRMVKYTPIDRMSSAWFDRALQWCATYRQPQIKKALRYYWNGVADGKVKPFYYKEKLSRNKFVWKEELQEKYTRLFIHGSQTTGNGYPGGNLCSFFTCKNPRLQHAINIAYKYEERYAPIPTKPIAIQGTTSMRHPKYGLWNNF